MKVKKANVPDLSDIISCSGSLLGINKINLTIEKKRKQNRERKREKEVGKKRGPKTFGCEMRWSRAFGFLGVLSTCLPEKRKCQPRAGRERQAGGQERMGNSKARCPGEEMGRPNPAWAG